MITFLFGAALWLLFGTVATGMVIETIHHHRRDRVIRDRLERIRR